MELSTLREFEGEIRKLVPGFCISFKNQSNFQKVLGFFVRPFNSGFMSRYATTFYPVVYFPSKDSYEASPKSSFITLAHELIHLLDSRKHPVWFRLAYALPQVLSPLVLVLYSFLGHSSWPAAILMGGLLISLVLASWSVVAFVIGAGAVLIASCIFAVLLTKWWAILFFVGIVFLAPWPSPGRVWAEKRGYAMTLAVNLWVTGGVLVIQREFIIRYFTGSSYYYMSWGRSSLYTWVTDVLRKARTGKLQDEPGYGMVYDFLKSRGLLYG
jgi:hypothetical protein